MRKFVLFFFTLLISMASMGQTAAQYTFAATSGTYTALSGATPVTVTGSADEGYYSGIPIGFNFTFAGTVYTQINVSTNGWLTLGTSGSPNTITTAGLTNSFASLYSTPTIAPLWDDNALSSVTGISYISAAGTAGNRITTIQYSTYLWNYNAASGVLEFQVRFYENGNKLDFIYHQLATAPNSASASIGIASANNVFLALDGSGTNPNASTTINTVTIAAKPAEGQIYTFTPPIAGTPNPPTTPNPADLATGVPVSGTCTWTFGTNTTTYDLKFGPTGSMVQVVTGAAAGANGTYTYSGLTPSVGYQWQVIEHNGALAYTGPTWNFTTACVPYATFPWTENFDAMGTVGVGLLPACWASSSPSGTPWYTGNAASITYNDPCSSPNYVYCYYIPSASDKFLFTPGFTLTAGSTYNFSFNWVGDGYSGWTGDVLVNSAQSGTGATALGASFLLPATTTTTVCTPAARTFIPATTGTYYFMIRVNNSSVPYYLGFDDFSLSVLLPCSTPPAQPTALVLTPSTMSVNGSFTAAAGTDKYLVVRSLSSTLSTPPVNGTTYTVGQALGNGFVDSYGATTTFTSTSLTPATPYYYFIFAANDVSCGGGPNYRTATPLTGNTTTVALVPISGNKTVGPTGDFFTLTAAFAYLNSNGVNGPLNLILQSTYVSSVEPAFPMACPLGGHCLLTGSLLHWTPLRN